MNMPRACSGFDDPRLSSLLAVDEPRSCTWSVTVIHGPDADQSVIDLLDQVAAMSADLDSIVPATDRTTWRFEGRARIVVEAMQGLLLNCAPHWWSVEVGIGGEPR